MTVKEIVLDRTNKNLFEEVLRVSHKSNVSRKQAYSIVLGYCRKFDPNYTPFKNYESFRVSSHYNTTK